MESSLQNVIDNLDNPYNTWEPTDERFVAVLDILGFKDLVARSEHNEIFEKLTRLSELLISLTMDGGPSPIQTGDIYATTFSDTIILISKNSSALSYNWILRSIKEVVSDLFLISIPIKGALAHGKISVDIENKIFFGQALIDAYLLQEELQYIGVVCHNSIDSLIQRHDYHERYSPTYPTEITELKTPFKQGRFAHQNIDWFDYIDLTKDPVKGLETRAAFILLTNKLKTTMSGPVRKYIDNTIDVFNQIYSEEQT